MLSWVLEDNWEGLYVDGVLKAEGHSISVRDVAQALGVALEVLVADERWLEEQGRLPASLGEVVTVNADRLRELGVSG